MQCRIILTIVFDFYDDTRTSQLLRHLADLGTLIHQTVVQPYLKFENSRMVDFYFELKDHLDYSTAALAMTQSIASGWVIMNEEDTINTEYIYNRAADKQVCCAAFQAIRWAHIQPQFS